MSNPQPADPPDQRSESVATVLVALLANLAIAVAKTVAGLISGSSAMLSEAAHSFADTVTEVLLFVALRRGARPPDDAHPFGHGKESYVWALLAAVCTFVAGAGFSVIQGVGTIIGGEQHGSYVVSYLVLAVAFVIECVSLTRAVYQVRREARRWRLSTFDYLRLTPDTAVKAVTLEDIAALIGLVIAAAGLILWQLTGDSVWDGIASIVIGALLFIVALVLGRANMALLVGLSVPPKLRNVIADELTAIPTIDGVSTLLTMQLGPDEVLVAANVDFADSATGEQIESAADEAERRLQSRFPGIRYLFLDPTRSPRRRPR